MSRCRFRPDQAGAGPLTQARSGTKFPAGVIRPVWAEVAARLDGCGQVAGEPGSPQVSRHLRTLRDLDLVRVQRNGRHVHYQLDLAAVERIGHDVATALQH